jgi:hypothetical protein
MNHTYVFRWAEAISYVLYLGLNILNMGLSLEDDVTVPAGSEDFKPPIAGARTQTEQVRVRILALPCFIFEICGDLRYDSEWFRRYKILFFILTISCVSFGRYSDEFYLLKRM